MDYLPISMRLADSTALLVGGGRIATRKAVRTRQNLCCKRAQHEITRNSLGSLQPSEPSPPSGGFWQRMSGFLAIPMKRQKYLSGSNGYFRTAFQA